MIPSENIKSLALDYSKKKTLPGSEFDYSVYVFSEERLVEFVRAMERRILDEARAK